MGSLTTIGSALHAVSGISVSAVWLGILGGTETPLTVRLSQPSAQLRQGSVGGRRPVRDGIIELQAHIIDDGTLPRAPKVGDRITVDDVAANGAWSGADLVVSGPATPRPSGEWRLKVTASSADRTTIAADSGAPRPTVLPAVTP